MTLAYMFPGATELAVGGGFNFTAQTIKCALLAPTYSAASPGTQSYFSEVQGHEVSGAGYSAGGVTLSGKTVTRVGNTTRLRATNPSWATLTATAQYAIFYIWTGSAGTSSLLSYMDFETSKSASAQPFTVILPTVGLITMQAV